MYSWKIVRTVCVILLAIPLVHLAFLVSRDVKEVIDPAPTAFQRDIDTYRLQDNVQQLPNNPILVVGGRRVKLWQGLDQLVAPRPVLMRGLGDAIIEDITFNYPQLIGYYQPQYVVLFPGSSEFTVRANKSADELARTVRELVELDESHGVTEQFYIVSPIKTLIRPQDDKVIDSAMRLLDAWAGDHDGVTLLDVNALLTRPDGRPDPTYFRPDGMQLNEHGYLRLSILLRDHLPPDAPVSAVPGQ